MKIDYRQDLAQRPVGGYPTDLRPYVMEGRTIGDLARRIVQEAAEVGITVDIRFSVHPAVEYKPPAPPLEKTRFSALPKGYVE